jgi:hypothetical protein
MENRLSLGIGWRHVVREGEAAANSLKELHGPRPSFLDKQALYDYWLNAFGITEREMEEMMESIARRYKATRIWRKSERKKLIGQYAYWRGFKAAAQGLSIQWW